MATGEGGWVRAEARRLLELAALTGLALVQPMLDVLGHSPETFVFRRVDGVDLVVFAFVVAVGPALVLWLVGLVSGLAGDRVRRLVHLGELALLLGIAVLVGLKSADALFGRAALVVAAAAAGLGTVAYLRFRGVRLFLSYLSVLPLLALGVFLFSSPASGLVRGPEYDIVEDPGTTTPMVMLVVDEFPTAVLLDGDGAVDARRFPNFARLGEDARWYRNYSTVNNFTIHAVPALLSAEAPEADDVPLLDDHPRNLFTLLGGTYELNASEAITRLCPTELCPTPESAERAAGLGGIAEDAREVLGELVSLDAYPGPESDFFVEPVTTYDSSDELFRQGREAEVQPTRFRDFLAALEPSEGPSLHYLHMVLPHEPWRFFPDGTEYRSPSRDPRGDPAGIWLDDWPARLGRLRFELQARYTDRLVGQFLDRLQETALWDEAVIVVAADHGAAFTPGEGRRVLTEDNAHEIMWSNLFIRAPGLASGATDVAVADLRRPAHRGRPAWAPRCPGRSRGPRSSPRTTARRRPPPATGPTTGSPTATSTSPKRSCASTVRPTSTRSWPRSPPGSAPRTPWARSTGPPRSATSMTVGSRTSTSVPRSTPWPRWRTSTTSSTAASRS